RRTAVHPPRNRGPSGERASTGAMASVAASPLTRSWVRLPPAKEILLDLRRPRGRVDLARRVGPFGKALLAKYIAQTDVLRPLDHFLHQVGWNERHAFGRPEHHVAGEDRRIADSDGDVHANQRNVGDRRRVHSAREHGKIGKLVDAREIADSAVHYHAGARAAADGGRQI